MNPFARIELLQAVNCKVLSINMKRVSSEKGYGLMRVIAAFDVATGDILDAIEAEPVKHGRWTKDGCEHKYFYYRCSVCGVDKDGRTKFCPNCGAKMDGKEEQG